MVPSESLLPEPSKVQASSVQLKVKAAVGATFGFEIPDAVADVQWHFYRKNNLVMMRWMALRARLLGLDPAEHVAAIQRWGDVLATFQIFDDRRIILV